MIPLVQQAWGSTVVFLVLGLTAALSLICLIRFRAGWSEADAGA